MEEQSVMTIWPANQKLEPIEVVTTSADSEGHYSKRTDTIMTAVEDTLSTVREENKKADPVAHIDTSEKTPYLKAFHGYLNSLGYKEISELLKISEHLDEENYNIYRNLPMMTKDYIDAEAKKDKINTKDTKAFREYVRIKVDDIISQLEIDKAFDKFKTDLNEAFEGKDCFEDLFNEDKTRIVETYEKIASSYEKMAEAIENPTSENTYGFKNYTNWPIWVDIKPVTINYDEVTGEYDRMKVRIAESCIYEGMTTDANVYNRKIYYIADAKSYREQAIKLRECKDGYLDALNFNLLVDYLKNNDTDSNRLKDSGKYIKRADRYITEFQSFLTKSHLEYTEPIKESIGKIAKAFKVSYDTVVRLFIILVLKLRKMEDSPKKIHYGYYSFQMMKRFYRMDFSKIQSDYVKELYLDYSKAMTDAAQICNKFLEV